MKEEGHVQSMRWKLVVLCAGLAGGPSGALAATHTITVNADGTFTPQTLHIDEGDTVEWVGNGFSFTHTDAIARIGLPGPTHTHDQICGVTAGGPSDWVWPGLDFYGPKRKGISGIHAMGPQGYGFIETTTSDPAGDCNSTLNPGALPDVSYYTSRSETVSGTTHLLCKKTVLDATGHWVPAAEGAQGGLAQVLQSTWDNPDIDGVELRMLWKDFQYDDGVSIVTDWTAIDREFREAIKRGKMISINIHAGEDTPVWIFNDYDRDPVTAGLQQPAESNVVPIHLRDYGSDETVVPSGCGTPMTLGSPADPNYVAKIQGLYETLAAHFKADERFFQVLGYVKVSGLNLFTGEARLPKRCLDPDASGTANSCVCNTKRWATTTYGYTPDALYAFYNNVENTILSAFNSEKSLHYMLIQDGFPRVLDASNYFRDPGHDGNDGIAGTADDLGPDGVDGTADDGYVGIGFPGAFTQTEQVLKYARKGRFAQPGDPATLADDTATGKLFLAQHSGLQMHPRDQGGSDCPQTAFHTLLTDASGKNYYSLYGGGVPPLGGVGTGCPNKWAAEEGYRGQLIGFQTTNDIDEPNEVDSTLWAMTSASNAAYYEIYEDAAWVIAQRRGTGPTAAVLDTTGYFPLQGAAWQKNLNQWGQQLHARRALIAAAAGAAYPHLADPFPASHSFTFNYPIPAGGVNNFWYINIGRCATSASAMPYGYIQVLGH
jgi:hypothetical protein